MRRCEIFSFGKYLYPPNTPFKGGLSGSRMGQMLDWAFSSTFKYWGTDKLVCPCHLIFPALDQIIWDFIIYFIWFLIM